MSSPMGGQTSSGSKNRPPAAVIMVPVTLAVVSELPGRLVMSLRALDQGAAGAWPGVVGEGANCGAKRVFT